MVAGIRCFKYLFGCLLLALTFAGANAPLLAADLGEPSQSYPDNRSYKDGGLPEMEVAEFCYMQGRICRKVCDLRSRFDDDFNGCPHSCDSRVYRCAKTGCYRWVDPDFLIAEKFGAYKCAL